MHNQTRRHAMHQRRSEHSGAARKRAVSIAWAVSASSVRDYCMSNLGMSWPGGWPNAQRVRGEEERKWEQEGHHFSFHSLLLACPMANDLPGGGSLGARKAITKSLVFFACSVLKKEVCGSFFNAEKIPQFWQYYSLNITVFYCCQTAHGN
jgi:hypothetical protein